MWPGGAIGTKLVPPGSRVALLSRPELLDRLAGFALDAPITLVCAGAGHGKTELVGGLYRSVESGAHGSDLGAGWYGLDDLDWDPVVFLVHLAAAMDRFSPGIATRMRDVVEASVGQADIVSGIGLMVNEVLERAPQRLLLVLDDVHEVEGSDSVRRGLDLLARRQPPNLHLVIVGRRRPALTPLPRLRAAGRVLELDESDLRLSRRETEALFREVYGLDADVDTIESSTVDTRAPPAI